MKGHSIPGIKGCKTTTLEDGRAASSAFQMQSPLHETKLGDTELSWDEKREEQDYTANRASSRKEGQSGVEYGIQELIKAKNRLKAKKDNEENPSAKIEEKINKYNINLDDGLDEDSVINKPIEKFDPLAEDKIKYGNIDKISNLKIK